MSLYLAFLVCNVSSEENVIVKTTIEIIVRTASDGSTSVLDELSLRHFVLHMRGAQVDREQDQGEAEDVHRVHIHAKTGVTLTESYGKFLQEPLKCDGFIIKQIFRSTVYCQPVSRCLCRWELQAWKKIF